MLMRGRREAGGGRSSGEKDLLNVMLDMSSEYGKDDGKVINRDAIRTFLTAEETVEIQGHTVPKGCTVLVNLWVVHRDTETWPELEKFKPERFLSRLEQTGFLGTTKFNYIPFSAGRRVCLGLPLATRMVHAMLGSLLHHFEWTLPQEVKENGADMSESLGLTMIMATPLQAIAKSV
nr:unnamed protein product [Digitaria exilis]